VIHIILGTRAQLIKVVPIMAVMKEEGISYNFVHTGQHRITIDEILREFGLKGPDLRLCDGPDVVSTGGMLLWALRILSKGAGARKKIFRGDRKGIVIVHGDTFSTLLGALLGKMAGLPVGHIESGLRSFSLFHPFPEELTRLLAVRLSDRLYCPGSWALDNVRNLNKEKIDTIANTMFDTVRMAREASRRRDHIPASPFALVSLHRYENIFNRRRLTAILEDLERVSARIPLLFILHPPTESRLIRFGLMEDLRPNSRIDLRPRYSYFDFFSLMEKAEFIISDGGSVQEEASYTGLPCLVMRKVSERPEGLGENVVLARYDRKVIDEFIANYPLRRRTASAGGVSPSERIVSSLREFA
jgi:UDP-N-acetylglucosamine 2-epimerase (non-hydrolysing)